LAIVSLPKASELCQAALILQLSIHEIKSGSECNANKNVCAACVVDVESQIVSPKDLMRYEVLNTSTQLNLDRSFLHPQPSLLAMFATDAATKLAVNY